VISQVQAVEIDLEEIDIVMAQALGNQLNAFIHHVKLFTQSSYDLPSKLNAWKSGAAGL